MVPVQVSLHPALTGGTTSGSVRLLFCATHSVSVLAAVTSSSDVCLIMIIICSAVMSAVVIVIKIAEWLIPPPAYCDAGGCSCLVTVAVLLFSSAEPT